MKTVWSRFKLSFFVTSALLLFLYSTTGWAATIYVGASEKYTTIQAGIDAASNGDTVIVRDGTYIAPDTMSGTDFKGKAITVQSENGPSKCIISGYSLRRGLYFHNGESDKSVLSGFTITACYAWNGGAIYCDGSSPTITNCVFNENDGVYGAAIYCTNSSPTITNCVFTVSNADYGSAIYCTSSTPTITSCTFSDNLALDGAAIYCTGLSPTITSCTFSQNYSTNGGAIYCTNASPPITNCTFSSNLQATNGGAIYFYNSSSSITNCTFSTNEAVLGGAIYSTNSTPAIASCTFNDNTAGTSGGAIYSTNSSPTISSCTFKDNLAASYGGAIYSANSCPTITNCTYSDNIAGKKGATIYSTGSCSTSSASTLRNNGPEPRGINNSTTNERSFPISAGRDASESMEESGLEAVYDRGVSSGALFPIIGNCTFSGSSARSNGCGILVEGTSSRLFIFNSILWDDGDSQFSIGNGGRITALHSNIKGGYAGRGNINAKPRFFDAASGDFRLLSGSPCIDRGNNTVYQLPRKDRNGRPRLVDGNKDTRAIVDMGAHEYRGAATQVKLISFTATAGTDGTVALRWKTTSETDNAGFNLRRSIRKGGTYTQVNNTLIAAEGSPSKGATYLFEDKKTIKGKVYFYKLQDVNDQGKSAFQGPVKSSE